MKQISIWVLFISFILVTQLAFSVDDDARRSLAAFLTGLSSNNGQPDSSFGWNFSSDPCEDPWRGVICDNKTNYSVVKKLAFDNFNLSGFFNASALCNVESLASSVKFINLTSNNIAGDIQADLVNCRELTHLLLGGNKFSGILPESLAMLSNLKQLDISNNRFSGDLPGFGRIVGLQKFLAQDNQLTGEIPPFDFSNLDAFNVSNNNFNGPIPDVKGKFSASCFLGNPELCGDPLPIKCPPEKKKSKSVSKNQILMYSGYFALGLVVVAFIGCCLKKKKIETVEVPPPAKKVASIDDDIVDKTSVITSAEFKDISKSEFSVNNSSADQSALVSSSLVVLTSPTVSDLKFEDLLRAPAELLGRGNHGTLYRVIFENGMELAVKRIKDWIISTDDFKKRMQRLDQVKHPNVLPPLAFYCSKHEKLLVYEYQPSGSLFALLHGIQKGQKLDWARRLDFAAKIAEALAFMHQELKGDGIAHGNLKSSNIILNKNMEPCISEYGLKVVDPLEQPSLNTNENSLNLTEVQQQTKNSTSDAFKGDTYCFGLLLLELLTGRLVQSEGVALTSWVQLVVREEWTVEVFDKSLVSEGANEERMLNLLQVAIKCVNQSSDARPSINQVATMVNTLKEEEDKSLVLYETSSSNLFPPSI